MKIKEILGEELSASIKEIRSDTDNYAELVFQSEDLSKWNNILAERLGPPIEYEEIDELEILSEKQPATRSKLARILAHSIGGIKKGQLLHYGIYKGSVVLIVLWPWKDNNNVTLKKLSYVEDVFTKQECRKYDRRALKDRRKMGGSNNYKGPQRRYHIRRKTANRRALPNYLIDNFLISLTASSDDGSSVEQKDS
ncbi:MAG: hypothetical protein Q7U10_03535 [Thermodesulfovibrionia bacterium]|nr:hypothetical protein [Thermodesulfovibrionia bacterium]